MRGVEIVKKDEDEDEEEPKIEGEHFHLLKNLLPPNDMKTFAFVLNVTLMNYKCKLYLTI